MVCSDASVCWLKPGGCWNWRKDLLVCVQLFTVHATALCWQRDNEAFQLGLRLLYQRPCQRLQHNTEQGGAGERSSLPQFASVGKMRNSKLWPVPKASPSYWDPSNILLICGQVSDSSHLSLCSFYQNTALLIGKFIALYFCWMTEWQQILSAESCIPFHLLFFSKWTSAELIVQPDAALDAGGYRGAGEELALMLSSVSPSVFSVRREPPISRMIPLPSCAWHRCKHFAACSECQFFISFPYILQPWNEALSLYPLCNTTPAQLVFPTLKQDVIAAFLWCSLKALPASGASLIRTEKQKIPYFGDDEIQLSDTASIVLILYEVQAFIQTSVLPWSNPVHLKERAVTDRSSLC